MKLQHQFVVPAPVEEAWAAFNDLERVVPCFPGATLTSYDGDDFAGSCKVKLGPVSLQYAGTGTFAERDPAAHHAVVEANGKDRRGNSTASVRVTARLTASGGAATAVTVETDLTITGRPAQFGRGLIQDVSDNLLSQFVTCLSTKLESRAPAPEPAAPPAEPSFAATSTGLSAAATSAGPSAAGTPAEPSGATTSTRPFATATPAEPSGATTSTGPFATATPADPSATATEPSTAGASARPSAPAPPAGPAGAVPPRPPSEPSAGESTLDLGAALMPALVRRVRPYLIGAAAGLILRRLLRLLRR